MNRALLGILLADSGNAWDQHTRIRDFKTGVGGEIKLDMNLAYHFRLLLRLGVAYGLDDEGVLGVTWRLAMPFNGLPGWEEKPMVEGVELAVV